VWTGVLDCLVDRLPEGWQDLVLDVASHLDSDAAPKQSGGDLQLVPQPSFGRDRYSQSKAWLNTEPARGDNGRSKLDRISSLPYALLHKMALSYSASKGIGVHGFQPASLDHAPET
jgi:hypothetical protein